MTLPNLIIIGAMKCGTSSLHNFLDAHPEISMSRQKELNFFSFDRCWQRGQYWYGRLFVYRTNPRRVVSELQQISQSAPCSSPNKDTRAIRTFHLSRARSRGTHYFALHAPSLWRKGTPVS